MPISYLKSRRFKRLVRRVSYLVPRMRVLYRLCKLYVDNYDGENNADMEINGEVNALRKLLECGNESPEVYDVGANRGQWCEAVLRIRPKARVHCFEPSRRAFEQLIGRGFPPNVVYNAIGMGERDGTLELHVDPNCLELSSVYRAGAANDGLDTEQVRIGTVSSYSKEHAVAFIDFLKIDVEGHEFAVLRGAAEMLAEKRIRFVQFEYGSRYINARVFLKDVIAFVRKFDYSLYKITPCECRPILDYTPRLERFENANYLLAARGTSRGDPRSRSFPAA